MAPMLRVGAGVREALASRTAGRFRLHSHAEHGNDEPGVQEIIFSKILTR